MTDINKAKSLSQNALISAAQIVLSTTLMFALYYYVSRTLGVEALGVWSVVLATTAASRLADLGLSASVTRFVALYLSKDDPHSAAKIIVTALLSVMVLLGVVLPSAYLPFARILSHIFQENFLVTAIDVLPFALGSLWLSIVASIFQSGLDGCQRMDKRALIVLGNQVLMVFLAFLLIPRYGVIGLAWAQLAQGAGLFFFGWLVLRRELPMFKLIPGLWSRSMFKEMLPYGANVQGAALCMMFFDPLTKIFMAKFGGPAAAGYFEIANQIVIKIRSVIVSANQAIVPRVVDMSERAPERIKAFYLQNIRIIGFIAIPVFTALYAWVGMFSLLMIGDVRAEFIFIFKFIVIAWLLNIFNTPAYFLNLGSGQVGWNTISSLVMGLGNALLGWILGSWVGVSGVVIGYNVSLVVGSLLLVIAYQWGRNIYILRLIISENSLLIVSGVTLALGNSYIWEVNGSRSLVGILMATLMHLVLASAIWVHPMRVIFMGKLLNH